MIAKTLLCYRFVANYKLRSTLHRAQETPDIGHGSHRVLNCELADFGIPENIPVSLKSGPFLHFGVAIPVDDFLCPVTFVHLDIKWSKNRQSFRWRLMGKSGINVERVTREIVTKSCREANVDWIGAETILASEYRTPQVFSIAR